MIDTGFSTGSLENTAGNFIMDICLLRKLARWKSLVSCCKNAPMYPVVFHEMGIRVDIIKQRLLLIDPKLFHLVRQNYIIV